MGISNHLGDIGEAAFQLEATKRGYWVAKTPQDCPYDFILDKKDGNLMRVQVKYRSINNNGLVVVRLADSKITKNRGYNISNIDAIAIYISDLDKVFLLPMSELVGRVEITLRCKPSKIASRDSRDMSLYAQW